MRVNKPSLVKVNTSFRVDLNSKGLHLVAHSGKNFINVGEEITCICSHSPTQKFICIHLAGKGVCSKVVHAHHSQNHRKIITTFLQNSELNSNFVD